MTFFSIILTIFGLSLFETIGSIDNAIINAQVLSTMGQRARRWFLSWGLLFSVFIVRGVLPWLIVWIAVPRLGPIGSLVASFSSDPVVQKAVQAASPVLLIAGGIFLLFLFCNWLFLEEKKYAILGERFFYQQGVWFFAVVSILLSIVVWLALQKQAMLAFGAVLGSTAFFITHGFRENAQQQEARLLAKTGTLTDTSKLLYLIVIDTTFSVDEVLGAFAFTLSVVLILIGNGLGAIIVRQLTVSNIERIKKYVYLENGAMYSIGVLGVIMLVESFGYNVPNWLSPVITFAIVGYFFFRSKKAIT